MLKAENLYNKYNFKYLLPELEGCVPDDPNTDGFGPLPNIIGQWTGLYS